MRFKFCWDCDCPDWILSEIVAMSKMNPDDFKPLVTLAIRSILGDNSVTEELKKLAITSGGQDNAGILAAVRWILESSASSNTSHSVLSSELLQLGLRKDHSSVLVDYYRQHANELAEKLRKQSLKVSKDLKFDYQVKEIQMGERREPISEIKLTGDIYEQGIQPKSHKELAFYVTKEQANSLLYEISEAEKVMKQLTKTED